MFSPDETNSNRWGAVFEVTNRCSTAEILPGDDHIAPDHQHPGFIDLVANKKAEIVRIYLPPDANTLLSVTDHCLRSRDYVNVIVAGKQPSPQWLDMDAAITHCTAGIGIWPWASNDQQSPTRTIHVGCPRQSLFRWSLL